MLAVHRSDVIGDDIGDFEFAVPRLVVGVHVHRRQVLDELLQRRRGEAAAVDVPPVWTYERHGALVEAIQRMCERKLRAVRVHVMCLLGARQALLPVGHFGG